MNRILITALFCITCISTISAQETPKAKINKPNYVSIMPAGFTYMDWGYYAYGFGLERKIITELGVSVDYSRVNTKSFHEDWSSENIKVQVLYYPINTKHSELSIGLAANYVQEHSKSFIRLGNSGYDEEFFYVGIPIAYRYTFAKSFFFKVLVQPTYSGYRYM